MSRQGLGQRVLATLAIATIATICWLAESRAEARSTNAAEVRVSARLHLVGVSAAGIVQAGKVASAQLGNGTMTARSATTQTTGRYRTTTRIRFGSGTLTLRGSNRVAPGRTSHQYHLAGTAKIVSGTGRFAHATGQMIVRGDGRNNLKWLNLQLRGAIHR
ncbi:hypothetical protein DSM104299_05281 [Baekduia alba]|uniref:hypothetical protein n=1 Tax=Baekduia alba TaxID=2997333 RepID=UPI00234154BB|nr:hypothetical protein [Baekduia alba]WCB96522.1 hypothetical protein DSM104299_05281 [Baekduia alba]